MPRGLLRPEEDTTMTCISPIRKMLAVASAACLWCAVPAQAEPDRHATYLQQRGELPPVRANLDTHPMIWALPVPNWPCVTTRPRANS